MCNNANRCPEDRSAEHRHPPTSPPWARDALRTSYKPEYGVADVRNFSIRPCCPGSDRGTRVADRRTRSAETVRHSTFQERATRVRVVTKQKRDGAARRRAHRTIPSAKLGANDRVEVARSSLVHITPRFRLTKMNTSESSVTATHNSANNSPCCA